MMHRCYDTKRTKYPIYGGRGITVCEEWREDPNTFIDWALANGYKDGLQIDRIDNDAGYSPRTADGLPPRRTAETPAETVG